VKWLGSFGLVVTLVIFLVGTLLGQTTSNMVHNLYFQSVAYPENFYSSTELTQASGPQRNQILPCLISIRDTYFQLAREAIEQCRSAHGNSEWYYKCLKDDPSASTWLWANDMILVVSGERKWVNTITGSNMVIAKRLAEQMQPGIWVPSIQQAMPLARQMLLCP
jgi:hypothetical protein